MAQAPGLSAWLRTIQIAQYNVLFWVGSILNSYSQVIGVDISPHMKPDDLPDNFWPQVRRYHGLVDIMREIRQGTFHCIVRGLAHPSTVFESTIAF